MDDAPTFHIDRIVKGALGVTHIRNMRAIPDVLQDFGLVPEQTLMKAGLAAATFSDPANVISISALGALLTECVRATGCNEFGFRVGIRHEASNAGLAGIAAINAATVSDALQVMTDYLKLSQTGFSLHVEHQNGTATASLLLLDPDMESGDQFMDGATAALCKFMRQCLDARWCPTEVLLTRSRPLNKRIYSEFFKAPIRYDASECALVFDAHELKRALPHRNGQHFDILVSTLKDLGSEEIGSFKSNVKSVMQRQIMNGPLTLEHTAAIFNASGRTFARRLEQAGLAFSKLAEEVKYETARRLLRRHVKFSEISALLGYADASVFTRSFKRWSGETPKSWRLKHGEVRSLEIAESSPKLHEEHESHASPGPLDSAQL